MLTPRKISLLVVSSPDVHVLVLNAPVVPRVLSMGLPMSLTS
jgi:hypothetical protein